MELTNRVDAFVQLGLLLKNLTDEEMRSLSAGAVRENPWFTDENVAQAIQGIAYMLEEEKLKKWLSAYDMHVEVPKLVGILMAGNIPLVGFHDLISTLLAGHVAIIKPSSQDLFLIKQMISMLLEIEPGLKKNIEIRDRLTDIDAVIATGSDNSARYFEYYFGKIPHIIRKNRTSVAVLTGDESMEMLTALGHDVFSYFGLGCRNVSKLFVPHNFDLTKLLDSWQSYQYVFQHHKYINNYDYIKSIYLINGEEHLDTGFSILRETGDLVSPISVIYYARYRNEDEVKETLDLHKDKIQCVVSASDSFSKIRPGKAQQPEPWDYADGVDTIRFLTALK